MRITFDISAAVHHHAGLGRYAQELLAALTAVDHANEYQAFYHAASADEKPDASLDGIRAHRMSLSAKPWRMSVLMAYLTGMRMDRWLPRGDIFHATEHLLPPMGSCKTVFTIHDLIFRFFPEYHLPLNRWYLSFMLPRFMQRADAIIAVSEHTRDDVSRLMGIPQERITVVYEGVHPAFHPIHEPEELMRVREKYLLPERFILYLSTIEPRKNLVTLLEAFAALIHPDDRTRVSQAIASAR